jgi:transposase
VLTEAHGLPIAVHLTPGQTADISAASALLADTEHRWSYISDQFAALLRWIRASCQAANFIGSVLLA